MIELDGNSISFHAMPRRDANVQGLDVLVHRGNGAQDKTHV